MRRSFSNLWFVLLLLPACQADVKKEDIKLPGHYTYRSAGKDKRYIDPQNGVGMNIIYADVVDYASNDSFILVRQKPSSKYFKNHLGFYLYFRYLIYADYLRNPRNVDTADAGLVNKEFVKKDSINYKLFLQRQASEKNTDQDKAIEVAIADSLIHHDPYYRKVAFGEEDNFWIIRLSTDTLLGPYSKGGYQQEREVLHVPASLKLKSEE
ncbi:MAG TPA: hypothetical protein VL832_11920 [Puia sp.]|nr:hypothetical protein [Puia sp.]